MKDLRILFMGTPEFAVPSLEILLDNGKNIVGVITAPDRPAGRGRELRQSAVKEFALSRNLKVLQPANLKDPEFLKELRELDANLQVVVAFRMLPKEVWQMPEFGTFNLHASLLPQYRGAAPINWAIIQGEPRTGVTTFFIDEKIDTGNLILQKEVPVKEKDDAGKLHDRLMEEGKGLVLQTVEMIEKGEVVTTPQQTTTELRTAYKLTLENTKIDWNRPAREIYNKVRGLSPYPAAWSYLLNGENEVTVKIYETEAEEIQHDLAPGEIVASKKDFKVAASDGFVWVKTMQLPGKKKMDIVSLLNGYKFSPDAKML